MGPSSWAHVGPKPVVRVGDAKIRRASSGPPSSCGPSSWAPVGLKPDVRLGDSKTRRAPSRVPSSCFPSLRHYRERCTHAGRRRTKPDTEAASATHAALLLPRPGPPGPTRAPQPDPKATEIPPNGSTQKPRILPRESARIHRDPNGNGKTTSLNPEPFVERMVFTYLIGGRQRAGHSQVPTRVGVLTV